MKKFAVMTLALLLAAALLAGCGAKGDYASEDGYNGTTYGEPFYAGDDVSTSTSGVYYSDSEMMLNEDQAVPASGGGSTYDSSEQAGTDSGGAATGPAVNTNAQDYGLKIIYTSSLSIETLEYDNSYNAIMTELRTCGGYIAYSDQWNAYNGARYADFEFRIPAQNYDRFLSASDGFGTVIRRSDTSQDVTSSYTDIEARILSLQTQESRLLELISEAKDLESLLLLEDKLTAIRYEIEGYIGILNQYDDLIAFCTVGISLAEVAVITPPKTETFWQQTWETITDSLRIVGNFLKNVFFILIYLLPYLIIAAVIIVPIRWLTRKKRAQRKADNALQMALATGSPVSTGTQPDQAQRRMKDKKKKDR